MENDIRKTPVYKIVVIIIFIITYLLFFLLFKWLLNVKTLDLNRSGTSNIEKIIHLLGIIMPFSFSFFASMPVLKLLKRKKFNNKKFYKQ